VSCRLNFPIAVPYLYVSLVIHKVALKLHPNPTFMENLCLLLADIRSPEEQLIKGPRTSERHP
jgi:hypothetical protein